MTRLRWRRCGETFLRRPPQPLEQALNTLAQQAGWRLLVAPDLVAGKTALAVQSSLTADEALRRALAGSGLEAVVQGETLVVRQLPAVPGRSGLGRIKRHFAPAPGLLTPLLS
jgi:hypothetical protein